MNAWKTKLVRIKTNMDDIQFQCRDCGKWLEGEENISLVCFECQVKQSEQGGKMITRAEYIAGNVSHREYYGQFADTELKQGLLRDLGLERIIASKGEHFNDIPLTVWDCLPCMRAVTVTESLIACGDFPSLAGLCCIAKEGARQLRDEYKI